MRDRKTVILKTTDGREIKLPVDSTNSAGYLRFEDEPDDTQKEIRKTGKGKLVMT